MYNEPNNLNNQSWNTQNDSILYKPEENHRNHQKNKSNLNAYNNKPIIYLSIVIIILLCVVINQNNEIKQNNTQDLNFFSENHKNTSNSLQNIENVENTEEITKKAFLPTVKTLSTGKYEVGIDIAAGLYDLRVESGSGLITGDLKEGYLSEMMGIMEGYEEYYSETYKNLRIYDGDKLEITSGVTIEFIPK